jgi:hypothetical protein
MAWDCGAHAHTVSVAGFCSAAAMDDALLAVDPVFPWVLEPEPEPEPELELPHAAKAAASARPPATPAAVRLIRVLERRAVLIGAFSHFFVGGAVVVLPGRGVRA